jgi:hypothetical protein
MTPRTTDEYKHEARRGRRLPQAQPVGAGRCGTPGRLIAKQRVHIKLQIWRCGLDLDLIEVNIQLFGHQHRGAGINALAELRMRRDEGDGALGVDPQKGVWREFSAGWRRCLAGLRQSGQDKTQHHAATGEPARLQQKPARGLNFSHGMRS